MTCSISPLPLARTTLPDWPIFKTFDWLNYITRLGRWLGGVRGMSLPMTPVTLAISASGGWPRDRRWQETQRWTAPEIWIYAPDADVSALMGIVVHRADWWIHLIEYVFNFNCVYIYIYIFDEVLTSTACIERTVR